MEGGRGEHDIDGLGEDQLGDVGVEDLGSVPQVGSRLLDHSRVGVYGQDTAPRQTVSEQIGRAARSAPRVEHDLVTGKVEPLDDCGRHLGHRTADAVVAGSVPRATHARNRTAAPLPTIPDVVDSDRMAGSYDRGRAIDDEGLRHWRAALADYLPVAAPVVDVGSGTGLFGRALVRWFGVGVVGIEPSSGMRARALDAETAPGLWFVGADGCRLPFRGDVLGAAWLSTVLHHLPDLAAAASDLRRALPAGAPVLIRSFFPGGSDDITLFDFFPGARRVADAYPTMELVEEVFSAAGFDLERTERVPQTSAPDLATATERARHRADTLLSGISDEEFRCGLVAMEEVAADWGDRPVIDSLDFVVFR